MEWSGRAPAPAAREAGEGGRTQGARHVTRARYCNRRDWHRYWQELVPRGGARQAWRDSVAAEVVAWAGRNAARQPVTLPDRHGGLRRGASPQPEAAAARVRYPIDAGEVRASLFEGTEERLPRCGSDRRGGAAPNHEIRRDEDRRAARLTGIAPRARAIGQPAHRHHQSDPRLLARARHRRAAGTPLPARRLATPPRRS